MFSAPCDSRRVGPDSIWFLAVAIGFGMICGIALWCNRSSATRDPHAARQMAPNKIERIRKYRQRTSVGLKEARLAIEAQDRGQPLPERTQSASLASDADLLELVQEGRVIEAIELYREQTGSSLAEAKQAIDRLRAAK
jgi:ribosomal protein L7/L12